MKMADDSERDVVPVKDGSSYERQRNVATFSLSGDRDILPAPYISKLDRKELEDRYMNLVLDKSRIKKECNKQEETIKRLATKLLRLVAEQKRDIPTAAQRHDRSLESLVVDQQQQIHELQQNNTQLQDRLTVLRNQLAEHTSLHSAVHCNFMRKTRSPARSNTRTCTSSRIPAVVPSHDSQNMFQENSQTNTLRFKTAASPSQPLGTEVIPDHERFIDEHTSAEIPSSNTAAVEQNQEFPKEIMRLHEQISILEQDLETQREQSSARISELEDELANAVARDQRQKVAENVEMIRLQRSLQQQSAHLVAQSAKNQVLEQEVAHLRQELEAVQQENDELKHQLMNEHQKVADMQQELQGVGSNRQSVRELQEQIRDVQNERSTLKEHNERLLALMSSRQIQSSEQEVELHSQVSRLETTLAKEQSERAQLMQQIKQLQLEVAQLEAALGKELKEKSSLLGTLNEMHQKMPEPEHSYSADKESALHIQVAQLEATLAKELIDRTHVLQSLEEERTQMAALKVAHTQLLVKLQDLQARLSETERRLQTLQQSPPRIPTLEESQLALNLHERLTSKPTKSWPVSSSASFTEDLSISSNRMNYKKQQALDTASASESMPDMSADNQTSRTSRYDRKSSASSVINKGFHMSTKVSTREKSLQRKDVNYCTCDRAPGVFEDFCACSQVSSPSLNSSQKCEESLHVSDKQESSGLHMVDAILMASRDEITINSKNGCIVLPHELQLPGNVMEKFNSISEEGCQSSDILERLKIPDLVLWTNDEVNTMAALCGENRIAAADQLDMCRELEKCRELLRVQYNLNSTYKKEVASLAQQLNQSEDDKTKEMDEMSKLLQMHTANISKLQNHLETSNLVHTAHDTRQLTVGMGEGLFEIHVDHLHLSPEALSRLVDQPHDAVYLEKDPPSLFVTWVFYDQDVAYTPVKAAVTNVEFDSSSVHRVTVNDEFLEYLKKEDCVVEVHMAVDDASETVASGTFQFSELLISPQNKIHGTVPLTGTRSCEAIIGFGILQCWYQLSCSLSLIKSYIQHRIADKVSRTKMPVPAPRHKGEQKSEISHPFPNKTPDNIITEKRVQAEDDTTANKAEEKVPVNGSTKEEVLTEDMVKEKGPIEGSSEESSAEHVHEQSVQENKGTLDRKPSDSSIDSQNSKQVSHS
ncbi:myosin-9-like isoform X2 [Zootermopsis nevadensis]|uniref:myosin-9-like isoform X2 n=1 Tax=Zootermopsis nevadensis TaxID=136037 RepID=UPI000B8E72FA|nr:myosin-9-like isoform X2 [Zootermopsis nevadensis]